MEDDGSFMVLWRACAFHRPWKLAVVQEPCPVVRAALLPDPRGPVPQELFQGI